jgi:hypothetical protein
MRQTLSEWAGGPLGQVQRERENVLSLVRVAVPGIIESFDAEAETVTVQPAIKEMIYNSQGVQTGVALPVLPDVPIIMPRAGDYALLLPVRPGDECLVVFADMCIDAWWQSGGVQEQVELRRHDLSDAFAILGAWSQPRRVGRIAGDRARLVNTVTGCGVEISGDSINLTGAVKVTGSLTVNGRAVELV